MCKKISRVFSLPAIDFDQNLEPLGREIMIANQQSPCNQVTVTMYKIDIMVHILFNKFCVMAAMLL